jgi:hypothetical protein
MPEEYFRDVRYPDRRELWLDRAAEQHRMIVCRCKTCKRVVRYLAADLLPILGPAHRAMVDPAFPLPMRRDPVHQGKDEGLMTHLTFASIS